MEWIFLVLFYALSLYLKKRQQKIIRKDIEDNPDWDSEDKPENLKATDFFEKFLKSQGIIDGEIISKKQDSNDENDEYIPQRYEFQEDVENYLEPISEVQDAPIDENPNFIKRNTIDRRLNNRRLIDQEKTPIRHSTFDYKILVKIFNTTNSLKKGIIAKEILDKPLALRKNR